MSKEVLVSLGFAEKTNPHDPSLVAWTHRRSSEHFYYHILTPGAVLEALIKIGHDEFRTRAKEALDRIDMAED